MKSKFFAATVIALFLASMLIGAFVSTAKAHTEEEPYTTDLIAGKSIDVGDVSVWNDEDYLYVKYVTEGDWWITEVHLQVAACLEGIPQAKGNPVPGKFTYGEKGLWTQEYEFDPIPLAWAAGTPLYIAAHAKVVKLIGDCTSWQWATYVLGHAQGTLVGGGSIIDPSRTDPTKALGAPDGQFYSLGFVSDGDGWIELGFGYPIYNGLNPDIETIEVTWGRSNYPEESADVYVWPKGGIDWVLAGSVTNHDSSSGSSYVDIPSDILLVEKVRIVDTTNKENFQGTSYQNADGFDLDAVGAHYLFVTEETAWGDGEPFPGKNWATYFTYKVQGWVLVDTFTVPATTSSPTSSNVVLEAGKLYIIEASGTYYFRNFGDPAGYLADAEYALRNDAYGSGWTKGDGPPYSYPYNGLDLCTDAGTNTDWGDFNEGHVYSIFYTGTGSKISLFIKDSYYGDNSGSLTVKIYAWGVPP